VGFVCSVAIGAVVLSAETERVRREEMDVMEVVEMMLAAPPEGGRALKRLAWGRLEVEEVVDEREGEFLWGGGLPTWADEREWCIMLQVGLIESS
jgi:hypothetical protein